MRHFLGRNYTKAGGDKMLKQLNTGDEAKECDVMCYGDGKRVVVKWCRYDPGCCVGHIVESHEVFLRDEAEAINDRK